MRTRIGTIGIILVLLAGPSFAQNPYYDHGSYPTANTFGSSSAMRAELDRIEAGFDKLPTLTGNANKVVVVDPTGQFLTTSDTPLTSSPTGWPTVDGGDVTFANSLANGVCIGAGNPLCIYEDSTLGALIRPQTDANTRTYIWTDKTWSMFDVEGNKDMVIADPDAFSTGSGTVTMQTGEQFVGSNLGIEFNESDTNPTCSSGNYTIYADLSENALYSCINGTRVPFTGELTIRKTSDEAVSSATTGTTLQNDDVLLFPVAANSTYTFKAFLRYSGATTGDLKFNFTLPASAVGEKSSVHAPIGATSCSNTSTTIVTNDITQTDANVGAVGTGAGNLCSIIIEGVVVTAGTAGNVTLQWAQVASDATNTTIHANSYLTYRRIP